MIFQQSDLTQINKPLYFCIFEIQILIGTMKQPYQFTFDTHGMIVWRVLPINREKLSDLNFF